MKGFTRVKRRINAKYCDKRFAQQSSLKSHEGTHPNAKCAYKCYYCDKGFNDKRRLNIHEQRHTGEKPVQCKQCDKRFLTKSERDSHEIVHSGRKAIHVSGLFEEFSNVKWI